MSILYYDFETHLIQPACTAPPPVCMVYAYDQNPPSLVHVRDPVFQRMLYAALMSETIMVAHYATFEVLVMMAYRPEWAALIFDKLRKGQIQCTLVREKLIRIGRGDWKEGFGLDKCLEAWKIPITLNKEDHWRSRYGMLIDKDISEWPQEAVSYVLGDIAVRDLYLAQETAGPQYLVDQSNQVRAGVALGLTSAWGFQTDPVAAAALVEHTEDLLETDKKVILDAGLARWTKKAGVLVVTKDKKAAEARLLAAYAAMGKEAPRGDVTEKMAAKGAQDGNVKLNEEACENSGDGVLKSYTRYGQAGTLLSKARRLLNSPIQCSYNVLVATGRTSCRQGDDPEPGEAWSTYGAQLQNLPRVAGVRECFVARPGHAIVSVDYDACELRTWAQVCIWVLGYSDLAEILNNPKRCPHVELGSRLTGRFVDRPGLSWEAAYKIAYGLRAIDKGAFKDMRGVAKGPGFGLPGGMGALRLVDYCRQNYGVVLTLAQAEAACKVWREIYREAQPYLDWVKSQVGRQYGSRSAITQFVSGRVRGDVGFTDAANGYFQGLAADIAKAAGWRLVEEAYEKKGSPLYGCRPLAFVHDEWLYEIPRERIHEAGHMMAKIMTDTAMDYCPDVLFTAAPAAMYRWSKAAGDPVYTGSGELICFEEQESKAA